MNVPRFLLVVVLFAGLVWIKMTVWGDEQTAVIPLGIAAALFFLRKRKADKEAAAFSGEIGKWPKVLHDGDGFLIKAAFASPRRAAWPFWVGTVVGLCAFPWTLANLPIYWPGVRQYPEIATTIGVFAFCVYLGGRSRPFWIPFCWVRLKIKVQDGGATWTGPRGKRCRIAPGEAYQPGWLPHRRAAQAARVLQEKLRRKKIDENQKIRPTYEEASEVIFRTGRGWNIEQPVAEIAGDVTGERALALQVALDLAIQENRKAIEEAELQQRATATGGGNLDLE